jgi:hypothetical protein
MTARKSIDEAVRSARSTRSFLIALLPLWGVVFMSLLGDYYAPLFRSHPSIFGVPAGLLLLAVATMLTVLGAVAIWNGRSRQRTILAFALLTLPATILTVATPSIIRILINLLPQTGG